MVMKDCNGGLVTMSDMHARQRPTWWGDAADDVSVHVACSGTVALFGGLGETTGCIETVVVTAARPASQRSARGGNAFGCLVATWGAVGMYVCW